MFIKKKILDVVSQRSVITWGAINLILILAACYLMLINVGIKKPEHFMFLFSLFFILMSASNKIYWLIAFPLGLLYAFYIPIGYNYGLPSYEYLAALIATDKFEIMEFFPIVSYVSIFYGIVVIILLVSFKLISTKKKVFLYKNKVVLSLLLLIGLVHTPPFELPEYLYNSSKEVRNELVKIAQETENSNWGKSIIDESKSGYDDYVLIIGESARKDYHNTYGYPLENTPFLSSVNGTFIDGFTAGGMATVPSLRLMLTKCDTKSWEPRYDLNFIDLINSAGIETLWLSNQGFVGKHDSPISQIAKKSKFFYFLKSNNSEERVNSDYELLPVFEKKLFEKPAKKRLIVLHLHGSHFWASQRIYDYPKIFKAEDPNYEYIADYLTSIHKTDDVLKKVYELLKINERESGRKFSIIYVSDHGQSSTKSEKSGKTILHNTDLGREHYDIPLIRINSDDVGRNYFTASKSALNFTEGIGYWIGIKNPKLKSYDLFSNKNDYTDYGLKEKIKNLRSDPPIIIKTIAK